MDHQLSVVLVQLFGTWFLSQFTNLRKKLIKRYSTHITHTTNNSETSNMERQCLSEVGQTVSHKRPRRPRPRGQKSLPQTYYFQFNQRGDETHRVKKKRKRQHCFLTWFQKSLNMGPLFPWHFLLTTRWHCFHWRQGAPTGLVANLTTKWCHS